jgi:hypothetical protein
MAPPKYICPACRQKTGIDISYGMPTYEAVMQAERGESNGTITMTDDEIVALISGHVR